MAKKICVIGGSGFVGRSIVRQALAEGHQVRIACRHPENARRMWVDGASTAQVDICTGKGLDAALAGVDCVINLVGVLFERGRYTFSEAHVEGTKRVINACKQAGITRYIHMSALGVDGNHSSDYGRTKHAAEQAVRDSGLDWTIMRPSVIFGREDDFFNKLDAMSRLLPVFPVIAGETYFQPVWVEDVARAFVQSVSDKTTIGQSFDLGGPRAYSFKDLVQLLLDARGRSRLCIPVPSAVAGLMATVLQFLPVPPLTPDQLAMLKQDNIVAGDQPFPSCFGEASSVEAVLPTYINGNQAARLQQSMNDCRENYRKL
jgi:NADH dehydrogenase